MADVFFDLNTLALRIDQDRSRGRTGPDGLERVGGSYGGDSSGLPHCAVLPVSADLDIGRRRQRDACGSTGYGSTCHSEPAAKCCFG